MDFSSSGFGQISGLYTMLKRVVEGSPKPRQIGSNPRSLKLLGIGHLFLGSCQAGTEAWSCWWPSSRLTGRTCRILMLSPRRGKVKRQRERDFQQHRAETCNQPAHLSIFSFPEVSFSWVSVAYHPQSCSYCGVHFQRVKVRGS